MVALVGIVILFILGLLLFGMVLAYSGIIGIIIAFVGGAAAVVFPRGKNSPAGSTAAIGVFLILITLIPLIPGTDYCSHQMIDDESVGQFYELSEDATEVMGEVQRLYRAEPLCQYMTPPLYDWEHKPITVFIRILLFLLGVVALTRTWKRYRKSKA